MYKCTVVSRYLMFSFLQIRLLWLENFKWIITKQTVHKFKIAHPPK